MKEISKELLRTGEIMRQADDFRNQVSHLKQCAPYYPEIYEEVTRDNVLWLTTKVKFTYNQVEYARHHVESVCLNIDATKEQALIRLHHQCGLTQQFAIPMFKDEIIKAITN